MHGNDFLDCYSAYLLSSPVLFWRRLRVKSWAVLLRHNRQNVCACIFSIQACLSGKSVGAIYPYDVTPLTIVLQRQWMGQAATPEYGSDACHRDPLPFGSLGWLLVIV